MKTHNILHKDIAETKQFILNSNLGTGKNCLVKIHSAHRDPELSVRLACSIKNMLPAANILGCAVTGVIYNGKIYNNETLISIDKFDSSTVTTHMFSTDNLTYDQVVDKISTLEDFSKPKFSVLFLDVSYMAIDQTLQKVSSNLPNVTFVGGAAGYSDNIGDIFTYVFNEDGYYSKGVNVAFISHENLLTYNNVVSGHEPISPTYTITKADKNVIQEIEGQDAVSWLENALYVEKLKSTDNWKNATLQNILLEFPIILEDKDGSSRFLQYDKQNNQIILKHSILLAGQQFKIGYLSPLKSVAKWQDICYDLGRISVESIFCYSCFLRMTSLRNVAAWEAQPFEEAGICGAFLLGEIGNKNGQNYYYNGSCSFFTMAEKENYIEPDLSAFYSLGKIKDDNKNAFIELKNIVSKEHITLFESILQSEEQIESQLFNNHNTGLNSMTNFLQIEKDYKKICLITLENASTLYENLGQKRYATLLKENFSLMQKFFKNNFPELNPMFYSYDITSFFFVVDDTVSGDDFLKATQALRTAWGITTLLDDNITCRNYFTVTLSGRRIQELSSVAHKQISSEDNIYFQVCDNLTENKNQLQEKFKIVSTLKYVLNNPRKLMPHFQGVYNNKKGSYFYYEALMRIRDEEGKILFPKDFLDIAKEYDMYIPLSIIMVTRVLDLFASRTETVSININAQDILSIEFKTAIFSKLNQMANTGQFMFEISGIEDLKDINDLKKIITAFNKYGIKVIVELPKYNRTVLDSVRNLDFSYLKTGIVITNEFGSGEHSSTSKELISFSKQTGIPLIMCGVETATLQKKLISKGIHYTQGYFFSNPMSFSELIVASEENISKSEDIYNKDGADNTYLKDVNIKKRNPILYWGAVVTAFFAAAAVLIFAGINQTKVEEISDAFLVEFATSMADKVSVISEDSAAIMLTAEEAIESFGLNQQDILDYLNEISDKSGFDDIYVSFDGKTAINDDGEPIYVDIEEIYDSAINGQINVSSPMVDTVTGEEMFFFSVPIYQNDEKLGLLLGQYELDNFSSVLDLQFFGGDAFFHLCETDGTPLVLSGNSENLFQDGSMYTFIGTLDITNGHTPESIQADMEKGLTDILKYEANGEKRTAIMVPVPNTDWCIVSIVLNEDYLLMVDELNDNIYVFAIIMIVIFVLYFLITLILVRKNQKQLVRALEKSYLLTNSLQTSIETDPLTRTYSRATATEKVLDAIKKSKEQGISHSMILLDVDNFKIINDTYGHQTGDIFLQKLVSAVKSNLRVGDIIGRMGGDEFMVLLYNIGSVDQVERVVDRIFEHVSKISIDNVSLDNVGISAGVVIIPEHGYEYDSLYNKADSTLYMAKRSGKNRYFIHGDE